MMGNMMLAAHALGLGSIWINRAKQEFDMPEYQALLKELGIEGEWEGIAHLARRLYRRGSPRARRAENRQGVLGGITFLEKGLCPFSQERGSLRSVPRLAVDQPATRRREKRISIDSRPAGRELG